MLLTSCNWLWRVLIAGVFLLAAWTKWQQGVNYLPPFSIYDRIVEMQPWRHHAILLSEVLVGLWVLSSFKTRWAASAAGLILVGFIGVLALELMSNNPADCGCGIRQVFPGEDPRVGLRGGIYRNAMLLLGCAWLWLMGDGPANPTAAKDGETVDQEHQRV